MSGVDDDGPRILRRLRLALGLALLWAKLALSAYYEQTPHRAGFGARGVLGGSTGWKIKFVDQRRACHQLTGKQGLESGGHTQDLPRPRPLSRSSLAFCRQKYAVTAHGYSYRGPGGTLPGSCSLPTYLTLVLSPCPRPWKGTAFLGLRLPRRGVTLSQE